MDNQATPSLKGRSPITASLRSGTLHKCQMKKNVNEILTASPRLDNWRRPRTHPHIMWLWTWNPRTSAWMKQSIWLRLNHSAEIQVYVWRYALLAVHVEKQEGLSIITESATEPWVLTGTYVGLLASNLSGIGGRFGDCQNRPSHQQQRMHACGSTDRAKCTSCIPERQPHFAHSNKTVITYTKIAGTVCIPFLLRNWKTVTKATARYLFSFLRSHSTKKASK